MNFAALLQHYFLHLFRKEKIVHNPTFIPSRSCVYTTVSNFGHIQRWIQTGTCGAWRKGGVFQEGDWGEGICQDKDKAAPSPWSGCREMQRWEKLKSQRTAPCPSGDWRTPGWQEWSLLQQSVYLEPAKGERQLGCRFVVVLYRWIKAWGSSHLTLPPLLFSFSLNT